MIKRNLFKNKLLKLIFVLFAIIIIFAVCFIFANVLNNHSNSYVNFEPNVDTVINSSFKEDSTYSEPNNNIGSTNTSTLDNKITDCSNISDSSKKDSEACIVKNDDGEEMMLIGEANNNNFASNKINYDYSQFNNEPVYYKIEGNTVHISNNNEEEAYKDYTQNIVDPETGVPSWFNTNNTSNKHFVIENDIHAGIYKSWFSPAYEEGEFPFPVAESVTNFNNLKFDQCKNTEYMMAGLGYKVECNIVSVFSDTLDLSNVDNANAMFAISNVNCGFKFGNNVKIKTSDKLKEANCMFQNTCSAGKETLKFIDFSEGNINGLLSTKYMFTSMAKLEKIKVAESTDLRNISAKDSYHMFGQSENLKGCNGTKYTSSDEGRSAKFACVDLGILYNAESEEEYEIKGYFTILRPVVTITDSTSTNADVTFTAYYDEDDHNIAGLKVYTAKMTAAKSHNEISWAKRSGDITKINYANNFKPNDNNIPMDFWFSGLSKLEELPSMPDGTTYYDDNLFRNCNNIGFVTIPNNITVIGKNCFDGCENLRKVVIGTDDNQSQLKNVCDQAFANCPALENFVVRSVSGSDSVEYGSDIFKDSVIKNPESAAPLIVAGGNGTNNATTSSIADGIKRYMYTPVDGNESERKQFPQQNPSDKAYIFLKGNFKSQYMFMLIGRKDDKAIAVDCVLDLNGNTVDANDNPATQTHNYRCVQVGDEDWNKGDCHFRLDDTTKDGKGELTNGASPYAGGGIRVCLSSSADIVRGKISNCYAPYGGGIALSLSKEKWADGKPPYLNLYKDSKIVSNHSTSSTESSGGGIMAPVNSLVNMYGGEISGNITNCNRGAGVSLISGERDNFAEMYIYNGVIKDNKLSNGGDSNIATGADRYNQDTSKWPQSKICVKDTTPPTNFTLDQHPINETRGYFTFTHDFADNKNKITINGFKGEVCTSCYIPHKHIYDKVTDEYYIGDGINSIFKNSGCQCVTIGSEVSEIRDNAFSDNNFLKKVVVENTSLRVGSYCFKNCKNLENYIVKADSIPDNIIYGNTPFVGAGSNPVGENHAPFIAASSSTGSTANLLKKNLADRYYTYKERPAWSKGGFFTTGNQVYYMLTDNSYMTESIWVRDANTVLDLNNYFIDRQLSEKDDKGNVLVLNGYSMSEGGDLKFRVDNTSDVNTKADSLGQIKGGYAVDNETSPSPQGGGINMGLWQSVKIKSKQLDFVNGNICNNRSAGQGGGIYAAVEKNDPYYENASRTINMYGGVIANNESTYTGGFCAGGGIALNEHSYLNLYGGNLIGNKAIGSTTFGTRTGGGAISGQFETCVVNIYSGRIGGTKGILNDPENNIAGVGGALYLNEGACAYYKGSVSNTAYAKYNTFFRKPKPGEWYLGGYYLESGCNVKDFDKWENKPPNDRDLEPK